MRKLGLFLILAGLGACGGDEPAPTVRLQVDAAPAITRPIETDQNDLPDLTQPVTEKIAEIRAILDRNSLTRLSRLANAEPSFVSILQVNQTAFTGTCCDGPVLTPAQLGLLFDGAYGVREVGDEVWFIWPELAALEPQELLPERLSFTDRAKLLELVGEEGIERIRQGQGYPGVRTAIAEDGRWLYFIHESEDMAISNGEE